MTASERARYCKQFQARRTSRIVNATSGYSDIFQNSQPSAQFDADDANSAIFGGDMDDATASGHDPLPKAVADAGSVPKEGVDNDQIYGAISVIQKHIESLNNADLLDLWASTADALRKTASGDMIKKAVANKNGATREPLVVNDNAAASRPGVQGYIDVSELESKAAKLVTLNSRIVNVDKL